MRSEKSARALPVYRCEACQLSFVSNREGKVACPNCGKPPAAGIPVGTVEVKR